MGGSGIGSSIAGPQCPYANLYNSLVVQTQSARSTTITSPIDIYSQREKREEAITHKYDNALRKESIKKQTCLSSSSKQDFYDQANGPL